MRVESLALSVQTERMNVGEDVTLCELLPSGEFTVWQGPGAVHTAKKRIVAALVMHRHASCTVIDPQEVALLEYRMSVAKFASRSRDRFHDVCRKAAGRITHAISACLSSHSLREEQNLLWIHEKHAQTTQSLARHVDTQIITAFCPACRHTPPPSPSKAQLLTLAGRSVQSRKTSGSTLKLQYISASLFQQTLCLFSATFVHEHG